MREKTPKSMRLHIGLFGRTNVGKSSFLNMLAGQDVSITSSLPGTTTDVVEKTMELLPVGPVVFLDSGGLDDESELSRMRIDRTRQAMQRSDVCVLVAVADVWTPWETEICEEARRLGIPLMAVINKTDICVPGTEFLERAGQATHHVVPVSCYRKETREAHIREFKTALQAALAESHEESVALLGGIIPSGAVLVFIVPIDAEAPKERIILPQVQAIRHALDAGASVMVTRETEYRQTLKALKRPPDLVVCDSQVADFMNAMTPAHIPCTTFSILFSRFKGDLKQMAEGAEAVDMLKDGDRILIAEACSHHPITDDIGRVKLPGWLKKFTGKDLAVDIAAGRDYPDHLDTYSLIIHCGACMFNRRQMRHRLLSAAAAGVPITNYGICIARLHGILDRMLFPFPEFSEAEYRSVLETEESH